MSEQVEPFLARRRVSGIVEVHEDGVEFPRFDGTQGLSGRGNGLRLIAFAFQQQAQGVADVRLVVGQKNSIRLRACGLHSNRFAKFTLLLTFWHGGT